MLNRVACAPCCWGIEQASEAVNPSWGKVLMEASEAGYRGIELGPDGFFPLQTGLLQSACRIRGLQICAGKIELPFADVTQTERIFKEADRVCKNLAELGVDKLLIMEGIHSERYRHIGQSVTAPRLSLEKKHQMVSLLNSIIEIANQYGLRCLLHPGIGGYISYKDEIEFVMHQIPASRLGLCLDVGHVFLDGMDPVSMILQYGKRIQHVHLKDVNTEKLRVAIRNKLEWVDAYSEGLITPLGDGDMKLKKVIEALKSVDYEGWLVVEHEHSNAQLSAVTNDLKRSRHFLTQAIA
ncbi:sugar phosphate isomerase/epimerase family protein [Vibrio agarivorans]|uniref:sugar phosphate isomerase/epimerase family protein n=1 Tax=Vibrio agarivorans TaxID=153622 RepID=UPI002230CA82|nr:sugar phosphate isomerase/epimerase [Vibrio agarivorans]